MRKLSSTILEISQIIGASALKIFKKRGSKAAISDYAILSGGFVSNSYYVGDNNRLENRTGYYWTKTDNGDNNACVVIYDGSDSNDYVNLRDGGVRPALPFSSISRICSKKVVAQQDDILEVEYGEYPQSAASKDLQETLENLFQRGNLVRTGKIYTRDKTAYDYCWQKFQEDPQEEYEYNGKKYVRVKANSCYRGRNFTLSNGEQYQDGDYVWVEVELIKWLVDEEYDIAVTEKILFAGIQFNHKSNYKGSRRFKKTTLQWYLKKYFDKGILPFTKQNDLSNQLESKKTEELKSPYQTELDSLQGQLLELIDLMSDDLKLKIQEKYNQIIDEYNQNVEKEKNAIIDNSSFFGIPDPYTDLYSKLVFLQEEICCEQNAIIKLKEIQKYRGILNGEIKVKNNSPKGIEEVLQNIKFELQMVEEEPNNFRKEYCDKIIHKVETIFSKVEEEYQDSLQKSFGYKLLSPYVESNPIDQLKTDLENLLTFMENPLLLECLEVLKSFDQVSDDLNIVSLTDHIKTINYVISDISNEQLEEEWENLQNRYGNLYLEAIAKFLEESVDLETTKELEKKFKKDLSIYLSGIMKKEDNRRYRLDKIEEVENSYRFLFHNQKVKYTVSSALSMEIKNVIPDLESIHDGFIDVRSLVLRKVDEISKKLNSTDDLSEMDSIMQEYYRFLTDLWEMISDIHSHQIKIVHIKKYGFKENS